MMLSTRLTLIRTFSIETVLSRRGATLKLIEILFQLTVIKFRQVLSAKIKIHLKIKKIGKWRAKINTKTNKTNKTKTITNNYKKARNKRMIIIKRINNVTFWVKAECKTLFHSQLRFKYNQLQLSNCSPISVENKASKNKINISK